MVDFTELPRDADLGGPVIGDFKYAAGVDPRLYPRLESDGDKIWFDTTSLVNDMLKHVRDAADENVIRILRHFYDAGSRGELNFEMVLERFKERAGRV